MTEQPGGVGPGNPVGKLQPLSFQLISDDGHAALYRALVADGKAPGSPVFSVTVTVASSVRRDAGKELETSLGEMKAAFVLLSEPPPDNGESGDEEPFDINTQMRIELGLASFDGAEPVGVAVTAETTAGTVPAPAGSDPGGGAAAKGEQLSHTVGAGLDDYWHADSGQRFTATVKPSAGEGTIGNPQANVFAGGTYYLTAKTVIVHASQRAMTYSLTGSFRLGHAGV
jgi:hypothetical protein